MKIRLAAALLFLALPSVALAAGEVLLYRDPGCGCCEAWAQAVRAKLGRKVIVRDHAARAGLQRQSGLPPALAACHTALVDGVVLEGHVPTVEIKRLLAARPAGVKGLAVGGMPIGSEGMAAPSGARRPYDVVAFGPAGARVFARY
jgi:hypothetical protein